MPDSESFFKEALKDKYMIWIFRVILFVAALFLIIVVGKAILGQHVNVFGIEINQPNENKKNDATNNVDTVSSAIKMDTSLTMTSHNPTVKERKINDIYNKKVAATKEKDTSKKEISQLPTITGKNINTGINLGQVGDNYISNQPTLEDEDIARMWERINDLKKIKPVNKCFSIEIISGSNGAKVAEGIKSVLINSGYSFKEIYTGFYNGIVNGITISTDRDSCLEISVGNL